MLDHNKGHHGREKRHQVLLRQKQAEISGDGDQWKVGGDPIFNQPAAARHMWALRGLTFHFWEAPTEYGPLINMTAQISVLSVFNRLKL